ncbi:cobalamin-dependent protein [Streptomyces sp. NPDC052396]|uniref:cobalamin-dependent protein n=1 Tax=Streptomyces sp. NPDC052396 TaxID=3365689 RepID=UPI0037D19351
MKTVTLVELTAFSRIIPLATAYLKSYATKDPEISAGFQLDIYDAPVTEDRHAVLAELTNRQSDVYALSCYVWNMELVRWVVDRLHGRFPDARFILGGPQVMHQARGYVRPDQENILVCDGEGERTFHHYLRELLTDEPDFTKVPGVSFWRDGELISTPKPERIKDLTEIPSPFTAGYFEKGKYTFAILESNRGCPYNCGFCFWGAATNSKVNRFETQRVLDDITWMSENEFTTIFLADANWGMAPRDVEFTRHMVDCGKRTGYPMMVSMNAAKNKPDRVAEITRILVNGGLLTSQPISLQSMDTEVLRLIDRSNIRAETYTALQRTLREEKISSYIEMIWPLPGESTTTFKDGMTELCRSRADTILVYPQLLLHNTPICENREALGIQVRRVPDEVAEAEVVVGTNWVTEEEYHQGVWLYYAVQALYNLRGLYFLANHLDRTGQLAFGDLFTAAVEFFKSRTQDSEICSFLAESVAGLGNYYLLNAGRLAHEILHFRRAEFDRLLAEFVRSQDFWRDDRARATFELDLLARPYIYREDPVLPDYPFEQITVAPQGRASFRVTAPEAATALLAELDLSGQPVDGPVVLRHPPHRKLAYLRHRPLEDNLSYCQGMTLHLRQMLPEWTPLRPAAVG